MNIDEILKKHKLWLDGDEKGERADLRDADLQRASLRDASLQRASLRDASLQRANLQDADLQDANLFGANLQGANLRGANLQDADLDFSCWPLWCGSKNVKVSNTIAQQLAAHFCVLDCDDKDFKKAQKAILSFAKKSHRAYDLGL